MSKYYRIVFEEYDIKPSGEMQENIILEGEVSALQRLFLDFQGFEIYAWLISTDAQKSRQNPGKT